MIVFWDDFTINNYDIYAVYLLLFLPPILPPFIYLPKKHLEWQM